ncbi:MAG TPA: ABC transporter permease [Steroidobacteraceae bacterium]|nr:ABC transporter permease [Steroidobacteraceae bacterium]
MIQRIGLVAARDYMATVSRKGFIFGLLSTPILLVVFFVLGPRILNSHSPRVSGQLELIDRTGVVAPELRAALEPQAIAARRAKSGVAGGPPMQAAAAAAALIPQIDLFERPPTGDLEREKRWLVTATSPGTAHLGLVVVQPDAVVRAAGHADYGSYDLYLAPRVDEATETAVHDAMREALIATRMKRGGIDRQAVESSLRIAQPTVTVVTRAGEQPTRRGFARVLPFIPGILLFIGIITAGPTLMSSTVEEKSSRVIEVLLASVSPIELMAGKLLGQLGVGLTIMAVYLGLGFFVLGEYSLARMLDPMLIVYLIAFYLLAYMFYGGLMLSIGAAINQIAEAQSLMGPVMILLLVPYMLVFIIGANPNSTLSVAMSFIPPINSFAMLARVASATPPPAWQVLGSMLVSAAAAIAVVWFAAKVFRIGLLMHGKPPNFATLIRWARMA